MVIVVIKKFIYSFLYYILVITMGYEFMLVGVKGRVIGDPYPDLDYLEPVGKEGRLFIYEFPDEVYNLHRKVDEIISELKLIKPREEFSAIYIEEYAEYGYEFVLEDDMVKVYSLRFKPYRVIDKYSIVPSPKWDFINE